VRDPVRVTITDVDYAPAELHDQLPFTVVLERQLPGDDRPDYWIGVVEAPLRWIFQNHETRVTHVVLAARWEGTAIEPGIEHLPVGIAYVTDGSLLSDDRLDLAKCVYVAIGLGSDTSGGRPPPESGAQSGRVAPGFGTAGRSTQ